MSKLYDVAVVGATGAVGETMLSILEERNFPVNNVYACHGKQINPSGNGYLSKAKA